MIQDFDNKGESLIAYLAELSTDHNQWGVWVNPKNIDEFCTEQICFDPEPRTGWHFLGNLRTLSYNAGTYCGSFYDFIAKGDSSIVFNGNLVRYNPKAIAQAMADLRLDSDFEYALRELYEECCRQWRKEWAESEICRLQEYFSASEEWEQEKQEHQQLADMPA